MRRSLGLLASVLAGLCLTNVAIADDDEELTLDQVPAAVKATLVAEVGENTLFEIEKIDVKGKAVYEAEFRLKSDPDKEVEVWISADGKVLGKKTEDVITLGKLPAPVLKAALAEIKNGEVTLVERENIAGTIYYEVEFELNDKEHEVFFSADGDVVTREHEGLDIQVLSR